MKKTRNKKSRDTVPLTYINLMKITIHLVKLIQIIPNKFLDYWIAKYKTKSTRDGKRKKEKCVKFAKRWWRGEEVFDF
jgi:hypothetical protein